MSYTLQDKLLTGLDVMHTSSNYALGQTFIIAGGAVRDQLLDKEINDIDIYTNVRVHNLEDTSALIRNLGTKYSNVNAGKVLKNQYTNTTVLPVVVDGVRIEFIHHQVFGGSNFAESILRTFDIGLCQVAITNKEELVFTDKFHKDKENKTLTLYPALLNTSQIMRSVTYHTPKLIKKFPDYTPTIDYKG